MQVSSVEATVPFYGGVIGVACWVEPLILKVTSSKPSNQSRTDKLWPRFSSGGPPCPPCAGDAQPSRETRIVIDEQDTWVLITHPQRPSVKGAHSSGQLAAFLAPIRVDMKRPVA